MRASNSIGRATGRRNRLRELFVSLDALIAKVEDWLAVIAGGTAAIMTCAIFFDVASRSLQGQSVGWGTDLTQMLMFPLTYAAAGYIARQDGHVKIDIITSRLKPRVARRLSVLTILLSLVFGLLLLSQGWSAWLGSIASGKGTWSVNMPQYWFAVAIPVGSFLLSLELAILLTKRIVGLLSEQDYVAPKEAKMSKPHLAATTSENYTPGL